MCLSLPLPPSPYLSPSTLSLPNSTLSPLLLPPSPYLPPSLCSFPLPLSLYSPPPPTVLPPSTSLPSLYLPLHLHISISTDIWPESSLLYWMATVNYWLWPMVTWPSANKPVNWDLACLGHYSPNPFTASFEEAHPLVFEAPLKLISCWLNLCWWNIEIGFQWL